MSETKLEQYFFTIIFVSVLIITGVLFYPFIGALALAIVLATLVTPLYNHLNRKLKRENLSAGIVVLIITLAILIPASGLFLLLVEEVSSITQQVASYDFSTMPVFFEAVQEKVRTVAPFLLSFDVGALVQSVVGTLSGYIAMGLTSTATAVFKLFVSVIALFYLLKDGRRFLFVLIKLSPLTDDEDEQIVRKLKAVMHSLIRGTLVIACLQGVLTGVGFLIFGVSNPVLWGSVAAIGALVPTLGTGIVIAPAVIYLALAPTGSIAAAIGLAAWGMFLVGLVDNIIGPKLIGGAARIHPLFIFLSVLGGLSFFGISGFLLGPLIFGLLVALSEIYKVKIHEMHQAAQ